MGVRMRLDCIKSPFGLTRCVIAAILILFTVGDGLGAESLRRTKTTSADKAATASESVKTDDYNPNGAKEFFLTSSTEKGQEYAYGFYTGPDITSKRVLLDYEKYHGMKGHFVSEDPVNDQRSYVEYKFYEIALENGDRWYHYCNKSKNGLIGKTDPMMWLDDFQTAQKRVGEDVLAGSGITVSEVSELEGYIYVTMSCGVKERLDQYLIAKRLLQSIKDPNDAAELLATLEPYHLQYDKIEGNLFVTNNQAPSKPLRVYLGNKDNQSWIIMRATYEGDSWLFVNSYIIATDDDRYVAENVEMKRDNAGGKVWEWHGTVVEDRERALLQSIAASNDTTIRFKGENYYKDQTVTQETKEDIVRVLKIRDLLK